MSDLLTYPTLVQSAYVSVKIGNYTFGMIKKTGSQQSGYTVDYPNFISSLSVVKTDGEINQYTIEMVYQITENDDPNFVDAVLSSVQYGYIYLTYGDYQYPAQIYRQEEALITDVQQRIDFSQNKINYTISATGTSFKLMCNNYNYPAQYGKPSSMIIKQLKTSPEFKKVFPGMAFVEKVLSNGWIPTDDKEVEVQSISLATPWQYIIYLTNCMISTDGSKSTYRLIVNDDKNDPNGAHFEIKKISKQGSLNQTEAFNIDIGYPSNNFVKRFSVSTTNGWQLLYNTSVENPETQYQYRLNSDGLLVQQVSPSISRDRSQLVSTANSNKWWKDMINFPITAEIQLKGLIAPLILLAYVDINVVFFGHKHTTSGMYFVTEQKDIIDQNGYTTVLKLQRIPT